MPCYVIFLRYVFQRRTREKLMNVLSLCGPESGLPKNPSVSGDFVLWGFFLIPVVRMLLHFQILMRL